ncbi:MAG: urea ABC transporter permease subunit UrtB [Alphaproteobacteria bacterium HGW-Alphaproteobacteria-6]|nr:MAG: urea ABC transporter permease subunit UrtB [Alphaproteobacteria bacterium HGW-Alphaproteobacteria-6]
MLRALIFALAALTWLPAAAGAGPLQTLLQDHRAGIEAPSRRSVEAVLDALVASALPGVPLFLERWQDKGVALHAADGLFYYATPAGDGYALADIDSDAPAGTAPRGAITELRPNGGVRREIAGALVAFQLSAPEIGRRRAAVDAIARSTSADHLEPLRASIADEPDPGLRATKARLADLLAARFGATTAERVAAIEALGDDLSVDVRAVLNQILATTAGVAAKLPPEANIARQWRPGTADLPAEAAYARLVAAGLAPPVVGRDQIRAALAAHVAQGRVGGFAVAALNSDAARFAAYAALAETGAVAPTLTPEAQAAAVAAHVFFDEYREADAEVTDAARAALGAIEARVGAYQMADLALDALSLASIYFLAAIGLAITFGVMGVINMAHGEFIMMGAYTGYVVQRIVPDYTVSILLALPLAFAVTFAAGVAMERLVIRHLYHRPLETLLATFGLSIGLQQLAKTIFGTQARPLTSPAWLDGAWVLNDVVAISHIRIAIFVLALVFLGLILFILKRTRLGLEVRAVTQNPGMAGSLGINPDRINMLTFGLGSGIAGIAGVAIGLYAKVTSEMGADYIVQSFMTVVVGGVGNVWGTLAGAAMIGFVQKLIEWLNPSNTLAAQTYMILFIILFIQIRPKGIVALRGRAAGD